MKPKIFGKNFPTKKILKPCRKFYEKFISLVKVGQKKLGIKVRILGRCHEICRKTSQGQLGEISNQSQQFSQISRNLQKTKKVEKYSKKTHEAENFRKLLDGKRCLSSLPRFIQKIYPCTFSRLGELAKLVQEYLRKLGNQKNFLPKNEVCGNFSLPIDHQKFCTVNLSTQQSLIYTQNL